MERYRNSSGESGVAAYEAGEKSIAVRFITGETYLYTYASTGKKAVEHMLQLAKRGEGLSTFISREVKDGYERKI